MSRDQISLINRESGTGLIENLVSLSILSIVIASVASSILFTLHSNNSTRTQTASLSEVQSIIDNLRYAGYTDILDKFNSIYSSIAHDQAVSETITDSNSRSSYVITYTAIKRTAGSSPEAVKIRIAVNHRSSPQRNGQFAFETIIAGAA
jgi:type II secretory pathway pseudopilin PulG